MKVYISVDFEGVAGSTSWSSTNLGDLEHGPMAREMTLEAAAACRGALAAGATEIYIKAVSYTHLTLPTTPYV